MKTSAEAGLRTRRAAIVTIGFGLLATACISACAEWSREGAASGGRRTGSIEGVGEPLGAESCLPCHGHQAAPRHHFDCETCHGSGGFHVQNVADPALIRFPADSACLTCHSTGHRELLGWDSSEHRRAGVLCTDCHDPHNGEPAHIRESGAITRTAIPDAQDATHLCLECHRDVGAKLTLPSHHPVAEGMLGCVDCHRPHDARRAGLNLETEQCTVCHQAQAGPFIFEHTPVVEDCGLCHVPHGAAADNLLVANQPGACVYCHPVAEAGAVHDPQAYVTRCTDCHNSVHGSFADPHLRR